MHACSTAQSAHGRVDMHAARGCALHARMQSECGFACRRVQQRSGLSERGLQGGCARMHRSLSLAADEFAKACQRWQRMHACMTSGARTDCKSMHAELSIMHVVMRSLRSQHGAQRSSRGRVGEDALASMHAARGCVCGGMHAEACTKSRAPSAPVCTPACAPPLPCPY